MFRIREVRDCPFYGLLPWWMYESSPHYTCGYLRHLRMNLRWAAYALSHGA